MSTDDRTPPLPEPAMEDVPYELWGQNVIHPALYTTEQMHAYAEAATLSERERCARLVENFPYWLGCRRAPIAAAIRKGD